MTLNATPRMDVVKRENKEAKLKTFISSHLETRSPDGGSNRWRLIARSPDSPVMQALIALAPAIVAAGVTVDTLLTEIGTLASDSVFPAGCVLPGEVRLIADARLLDAHEQLVLDHRTSWIGDCMRRDPAKRDAYECHAAVSAEIADWCSKTFERLWDKGTAVIAAVPLAEAGGEAATEVEPCLPQAGQVPSTVVALTRH
jgi:hypothetical protein